MIAVTIDGVLVAPEEAKISVFDRGLLFGDGVFEVLRTWDGIATDLDAHVGRLLHSAATFELRAPTPEAIVAAVRVALDVASAGAGEHRIRIVLTRGPGPLVARVGTLGPGKTIVIVEPLPAQPTEIAVALVQWPMPRRTSAGHKTLAYLDHIVARELAAAAGADEGIRLDPDGNVVECSTANIFAVASGTVLTPPVESGALPGITRARVLAVCENVRIPVAVRPIPVGELVAADELFITSALRGVVPVTRVDGNPRAAGPVTARISDAFSKALRGT